MRLCAFACACVCRGKFLSNLFVCRELVTGEVPQRGRMRDLRYALSVNLYNISIQPAHHYIPHSLVWGVFMPTLFLGTWVSKEDIDSALLLGLFVTVDPARVRRMIHIETSRSRLGNLL